MISPKNLRTVSVGAGVLALLFLILYSGGFLSFGKIAPGRDQGGRPPAPAKVRTAKAVKTSLPEFYRAVGTVRPRTEIKVEAQVSGRVTAVKVRSGEKVRRGDLLALLDDQRYQARLEQARQGLAGARAVLERALSEYRRVRKYLAGEAATQRDLEAAREVRLPAEAPGRRAGKLVEVAEIALSHTRIKAPADGQVVRRLVEPGDLALPGRPLLLMQTEKSLLLEALVREGLIFKIKPGQRLKVEVPALKRELEGEVLEIVPSADPLPRTFFVKAQSPPTPGLHTGMSGRLLTPVGRREAVLVPAEAIRRGGQLEMVTIKTPGGWRRVYVASGRRWGGRVEILSGLNGGETLALERGGDA